MRNEDVKAHMTEMRHLNKSSLQVLKLEFLPCGFRKSYIQNESKKQVHMKKSTGQKIFFLSVYVSPN
jgi:hypothetical protein